MTNKQELLAAFGHGSRRHGYTTSVTASAAENGKVDLFIFIFNFLLPKGMCIILTASIVTTFLLHTL